MIDFGALWQTLGFGVSESQRRVAERALQTLSLQPRHSVLELEPGQGLFTQILLNAMGKDASLTVQQPAALNSFFGASARRLVQKQTQLNATYSDTTFEDLSAPNASVDRVLWKQGPHELWAELGPGVQLGHPKRVFAEIARVLKPGGLFVLIDNLAPTGVDMAYAGNLHRSVPALLRPQIEAHDLTLISEAIDWESNAADPLNVPTYSPGVHLKTSQFLQVYRK